MEKWRSGEKFSIYSFGGIVLLTRRGWRGISLEMEMKAADLFLRNVIYYLEDCLTSSRQEEKFWVNFNSFSNEKTFANLERKVEQKEKVPEIPR